MSKPPPIVPDDAPHLLVVDDDNRIRALLNRFLSEQGFRVTMAENAESARAKIEALSFDMMILDVMMPGENGFELATHIRETSDVPLLMLTAQADSVDRIRGLEIGADDYLPKPFEPRELLLRISNILRRSAVPSRPVEPAREAVRFGGFSFHLRRGELQRDGETIRITERERDILRILTERPGEAVDRTALVGASLDGPNERAVDVQINRLRRKLEKDPSNPVYLQTVRGSGYRLAVDP
jgi:two-component system phosphate regulon response regulator OmpR